jgi:hypothetical protein
MKTPTAIATRIHVVLARRARVGVVLRRGPAEQVEMLRWDLATDELQRGQWLRAKVRSCGLSPDGKLLVYFAARFRGRLQSFTAVSRPPWFTALALWPDGETYGGGGFFESNRTLVLGYLNPSRPLESSPVPPHLTVRCRRMGENEHDGWIQQQVGRDAPPTQEMRVVFSPPWQSIKVNPVHPDRVLRRDWHGMFEVNGTRLVNTYHVLRGDEQYDLGRLDWADWDHHEGSLLFARDGRLYRTKLDGQEREIADLRHHRFRAIISPREAREWPQQK